MEILSKDTEQLGKYKEPKMWEDLTPDEKIERTREEVKNSMKYSYQRISDLNKIIDKLKVHGHLDGKVVFDINKSDGFSTGECSAKRADGKSYF